MSQKYPEATLTTNLRDRLDDALWRECIWGSFISSFESIPKNRNTHFLGYIIKYDFKSLNLISDFQLRLHTFICLASHIDSLKIKCMGEGVGKSDEIWHVDEAYKKFASDSLFKLNFAKFLNTPFS